MENIHYSIEAEGWPRVTDPKFYAEFIAVAGELSERCRVNGNGVSLHAKELQALAPVYWPLVGQTFQAFGLASFNQGGIGLGVYEDESFRSRRAQALRLLNSLERYNRRLEQQAQQAGLALRISKAALWVAGASALFEAVALLAGLMK